MGIPNKIACLLCNKNIILDGNCLLEHVSRRHVNMGTQKCFACEFTCETLEEGAAHIAAEHTPMTAYLLDVSELVEKKKREVLEECFPAHHQLAFLPSTFLKCRECRDKVRNNWSSIESHARYHVDISPSRCSLCPQSFSTGQMMNDHMWSDHTEFASRKTAAGHLKMIGMVEKCFPGSSGPSSPSPKRCFPSYGTPSRAEMGGHERMPIVRRKLF